jgi:hypothetical protein
MTSSGIEHTTKFDEDCSATQQFIQGGWGGVHRQHGEIISLVLLFKLRRVGEQTPHDYWLSQSLERHVEAQDNMALEHTPRQHLLRHTRCHMRATSLQYLLLASLCL